MSCHNCGKIGHLAKNCWKNNDAKGGKSKAAVAVACEEEEEIALKCLTKHSKVNESKLFIDSGVSQHMTPNLDLIDNYKKYEVPQAVKMGRYPSHWLWFYVSQTEEWRDTKCTAKR